MIRPRVRGLLLMVTGLVLAGAPATGWTQPPADAPRQPSGREARPVSVESVMKQMNRALKSLGRQYDKPGLKRENLELVATAQRAALTAKGLEPPKTPTTGKDEYLTKFRLGQIGLMRMLLDLEEAVANDKADDAKKVLATLAEYRDKEHKEFGVKDDEDTPAGADGRK